VDLYLYAPYSFTGWTGIHLPLPPPPHLTNVDMAFTDSGSYMKKSKLKKERARVAYETEIPTPTSDS
jgi:hypothetical protein